MLRGAVVILLDPEGRTLLLKRHESSKFAPNKWGFPGGKIEEGETASEAARRETEEETSLVVMGLKDLGRFQFVRAYLATDYEGDVMIDHEHTDWAWVRNDDLGKYDLAPNVLEIYDRALKYGH